MECNDEMVEMTAILGITALGATAIIIDGQIGEVIAIAVSGALGFMAAHLWRVGKDIEGEKQ